MLRLGGNRRLNAWLARLLVALLLVSQALVAAHACPPGLHSVNQALAAPATDHATCHEESPASRDANLCVAHCTAADQRDATPLVIVAMMPATPVLVLDVVESSPRLRATRPDAPDPTGGPPPAIRFQILRI